MFDDVMAEVAAKSAPDWNNLKPRQRLVAVLFCLYNHTDDPEVRAMESVELLREAAGDGIPPMLCSELCSKMVSLTRRYMGVGVEDKDRIGDPEFREGVFQVIESVLNVLSKEEATILIQERIRGFSCTQDCHRPY